MDASPEHQEEVHQQCVLGPMLLCWARGIAHLTTEPDVVCAEKDCSPLIAAHGLLDVNQKGKFQFKNRHCKQPTFEQCVCGLLSTVANEILCSRFATIWLNREVSWGQVHGASQSRGREQDPAFHEYINS